jgi:hypothetical protein
MGEDTIFEAEIKKLGEVKQGIYEAANEEATLSPSVVEAVRNTALYLDTAYLWITQLKYFIEHGGTGPVPEVKDGEVVVGQAPAGETA